MRFSLLSFGFRHARMKCSERGCREPRTLSRISFLAFCMSSSWPEGLFSVGLGSGSLGLGSLGGILRSCGGGLPFVGRRRRVVVAKDLRKINDIVKSAILFNCLLWYGEVTFDANARMRIEARACGDLALISGDMVLSPYNYGRPSASTSQSHDCFLETYPRFARFAEKTTRVFMFFDWFVNVYPPEYRSHSTM
jgi:hypothetical protein